MTDKLKMFTNSRRSCFQRCPREHYYAYELKRRPIREAYPLRFGRLWHLGLEQWYLTYKDFQDEKMPWKDDVALSVALSALQAAYAGQADENSPLDEFDLVKAEVMMLGYHCRWSGAMLDDLRVLEVEVRFECPMVNPETGAASRTWRLAGVLDVLLQSRTGQNVLMEHKSSSEDILPGSKYWGRLRMDGQVSGYYHGAESAGYPITGCIYDVAKKPAKRPLKATPEDKRKYRKDGQLYANQRDVDETPEEYRGRLMEAIAENPDTYFQRGDVYRLEEEIREYQADAWIAARMMRESARLGAHVRNPNSCERYGHDCDYLPVCNGERDIEDNAHYQTGRIESPELAEPKEEVSGDQAPVLP